MKEIDEILNKLSKSTFRTSFKLKDKDKLYIEEKGLFKISEHAYDFVNKRLKPGFIENDGKQTPTKGHPVFIAQHASACCCRGCLEKWHYIANNHELTNREIKYVVNVIMRWIQRNM